MFTTKRLLLTTSTAAILFKAAELTANDEWDTLYDSIFRTKSIIPRDERPKIVVLGTGWAACSFLRKLHTDKYHVTVVSPRNHFLYTPLLCGTTVGTVEPRSIIEPIRTLLNRSNASDVTYIQASASAINPTTQSITCKTTAEEAACSHTDIRSFDLPYDHLIVAVGCQPTTFGTPGVLENGFFLKELGDAQKIRNRISDLLETASLPGTDLATKKRLLHFCVVGGGPTGIEFAAELHDFLKEDIPVAFPNLDSKNMAITVFEAMPHVLGSFDSELQQETEAQFEREHINIQTETMVTKVNPKAVTVRLKNGDIQNIDYGLLVWVAGIGTRPIVHALSECITDPKQRSRRGLQVDGCLRVVGIQNAGSIFALGDCGISGHAPTAQVASQEGRYCATVLNALQEKENRHVKASTFDLVDVLPNVNTFEYKHKGSFAYIGNGKAVAQIPKFSGGDNSKENWNVNGRATYAAWRGVYWTKLLSVKNRFLVGGDWIKTEVFGRALSRE